MESSTGNIEATQIDTKISTLRDSMLCSAIISAETSTETKKSTIDSKQRLGRAKIKISKPQAVSEAAKGHFENPQAVTKENLCASSKRNLEAYRARNLEPQEGELANRNDEMFETILQSRLPEKLIDETHASQVTVFTFEPSITL
jgi:hypothetical protein